MSNKSSTDMGLRSRAKERACNKDILNKTNNKTIEKSEYPVLIG
jgi:hypothetical protein